MELDPDAQRQADQQEPEHDNKSLALDSMTAQEQEHQEQQQQQEEHTELQRQENENENENENNDPASAQSRFESDAAGADPMDDDDGSKEPSHRRQRSSAEDSADGFKTGLPDSSSAASQHQPQQKHEQVDRKKTCPFLVRTFVTTGSFASDLFGLDSPKAQQAEVALHCWDDTTLRELAAQLAIYRPETLHPSAKLTFRIVSNPLNSTNIRAAQTQSVKLMGTLSNHALSSFENRTLRSFTFRSGNFVEVRVADVSDGASLAAKIGERETGMRMDRVDRAGDLSGSFNGQGFDRMAGRLGSAWHNEPKFGGSQREERSRGGRFGNLNNSKRFEPYRRRD
eukprot:jgi/Hompol1/813/HPOL_001783-RA